MLATPNFFGDKNKNEIEKAGYTRFFEPKTQKNLGINNVKDRNAQVFNFYGCKRFV